MFVVTVPVRQVRGAIGTWNPDLPLREKYIVQDKCYAAKEVVNRLRNSSKPL